jgi:hypothetical protein
MEKQLNTDISQSGGKVFNKTAISLGFLTFTFVITNDHVTYGAEWRNTSHAHPPNCTPG